MPSSSVVPKAGAPPVAEKQSAATRHHSHTEGIRRHGARHADLHESSSPLVVKRSLSAQHRGSVVRATTPPHLPKHTAPMRSLSPLPMRTPSSSAGPGAPACSPPATKKATGSTAATVAPSAVSASDYKKQRRGSAGPITSQRRVTMTSPSVTSRRVSAPFTVVSKPKGAIRSTSPATAYRKPATPSTAPSSSVPQGGTAFKRSDTLTKTLTSRQAKPKAEGKGKQEAVVPLLRLGRVAPTTANPPLASAPSSGSANTATPLHRSSTLQKPLPSPSPFSPVTPRGTEAQPSTSPLRGVPKSRHRGTSPVVTASTPTPTSPTPASSYRSRSPGVRAKAAPRPSVHPSMTVNVATITSLSSVEGEAPSSARAYTPPPTTHTPPATPGREVASGGILPPTTPPTPLSSHTRGGGEDTPLRRISTPGTPFKLVPLGATPHDDSHHSLPEVDPLEALQGINVNVFSAKAAAASHLPFTVTAVRLAASCDRLHQHHSSSRAVRHLQNHVVDVASRTPSTLSRPAALAISYLTSPSPSLSRKWELLEAATDKWCHPSMLLREAALYACTKCSPHSQIAREVGSITSSLWQSSIPLQVAAIHPSGAVDTDLLTCLDDALWLKGTVPRDCILVAASSFGHAAHEAARHFGTANMATPPPFTEGYTPLVACLGARDTAVFVTAIPSPADQPETWNMLMYLASGFSAVCVADPADDGALQFLAQLQKKRSEVFTITSSTSEDSDTTLADKVLGAAAAFQPRCSSMLGLGAFGRLRAVRCCVSSSGWVGSDAHLSSMASALCRRRGAVVLQGAFHHHITEDFLQHVLPRLRFDSLKVLETQLAPSPDPTAMETLFKELGAVTEVLVSAVRNDLSALPQVVSIDATARVKKLMHEVERLCLHALSSDVHALGRRGCVLSGPVAAVLDTFVASANSGVKRNDNSFAAVWDRHMRDHMQQTQSLSFVSGADWMKRAEKAALDAASARHGVCDLHDARGINFSELTADRLLQFTSGEVSEDVLLALDELAAKVPSTMADAVHSCCSQHYEIVDPEGAAADGVCQALDGIVALERRLLWPHGCTLTPEFLADVVVAMQGMLVEGISHTIKERELFWMHHEAAGLKRTILAALDQWSVSKGISHLVAAVFAFALESLLAQKLRILLSIPPTRSSDEGWAEKKVSAMWKEAMQAFHRHVTSFRQEGTTCFSDFLKHLLAFDCVHINPSFFTALRPLEKIESPLNTDVTLSALTAEAIDALEALGMQVPVPTYSTTPGFQFQGEAGTVTTPEPTGSAAYWGLGVSRAVGKADAWGIVGKNDVPIPETPTMLMAVSFSEAPPSDPDTLSLANDFSTLFKAPTPFHTAVQLLLTFPPSTRWIVATLEVNISSRGHPQGVLVAVPGSHSLVSPPSPSSISASATTTDGYATVEVPVPEGAPLSTVLLIGSLTPLTRVSLKAFVTDANRTPVASSLAVLQKPAVSTCPFSLPALPEYTTAPRLGPLADCRWHGLPQLLLQPPAKPSKITLALSGCRAALAVVDPQGIEGPVPAVAESVEGGQSGTLLKATVATETPFGDHAVLEIEGVTHPVVVVPYVDGAGGEVAVMCEHDDPPSITEFSTFSIPEERSTVSIPFPRPSLRAGPSTMECPQLSLAVFSNQPAVLALTPLRPHGTAAWLVYNSPNGLAASSDADAVAYCVGGEDGGEAAASLTLEPGLYTVLVAYSNDEGAPNSCLFSYQPTVHNAAVLYPSAKALRGESTDFPVAHVFSGVWRGSSAGGGLGAPTFAGNPQYTIFAGKECIVRITLSAPSHGETPSSTRGLRGSLTSSNSSSLRSHTSLPFIFVTGRPKVVGVRRDMGVGHREVPAVSTQRFGDYIEATFTAEAHTAYTVVPYLCEREERSFDMRVVSSCPLAHPVALAEEWAVVHHADGAWQKGVTAGGFEGAKACNPQFLVTINRACVCSFTLAAFGMGPLGMYLATPNEAAPTKLLDTLEGKVVARVLPEDTDHPVEQVSLELPPNSSEDKWEQFVLVCCTKFRDIEGSFRVSILSEGSCMVRAL